MVKKSGVVCLFIFFNSMRMILVIVLKYCFLSTFQGEHHSVNTKKQCPEVHITCDKNKIRPNKSKKDFPQFPVLLHVNLLIIIFLLHDHHHLGMPIYIPLPPGAKSSPTDVGKSPILDDSYMFLNSSLSKFFT